MIPQSPITNHDIEKQLAKNLMEANYYIETWFVIDDGE